MRVIKEKRHKVAKAQSDKGKEKNSVPLCLSASKRGFTLIELMAVIAIIMILAAIMMPNVARHVERGRVAKAEADMDVLIKAISLFQIDHEGDLPQTENLSELWNDPKGPYISDPEISKTPWGTSYEYTPGTNSYTVQAKDKNGNVKVEKTINF